MQPPQLQPAASVILLDPQRGGGEPFGIFLLQRQAKSRFMPGRFVFPGGRLEPSDGPDPDSDQARRICALRELWEEAGVVLAEEKERLARLTPDALDHGRRELMRGALDLQEALAGLGLSPDLEALVPYARWITPAARSQRFDTTFYLARMPEGQKADCDRRETSQGVWLGPAAALGRGEGGGVSLAPPQVRILGELCGYASLEELWDDCLGRKLEPIEPYMWVEGSRRMVLLPWDRGYARRDVGDPQAPGRPCHPGRASRLVFREGAWLPYLKE